MGSAIPRKASGPATSTTGNAALRIVWLVVLAAFVLRAGWVLYRWHAPGPEPYSDEELHWQLATNLAQHGTLVTGDGRYAARMPLYPLFLALFAGTGPAGMLVVKLAQAAIGAATAGVACRLAGAVCADALGSGEGGTARREDVARLAALIAGLLVAFDPFGVFFANLLLSETLFGFLLLATVAAAWRFLARPQARPAGRLALLGAGLILTRPSAALLVPLLWGLLWFLSGDRRLAARRLVVCPVVLGLLMLPWGLRNRAVLGSFAWLSTNGGATLYDAQGPQADGSSRQDFLRQRPEFQGLGEVALDRELGRQARAQMAADPVRVLKLAGAKFLRTWSLTPNVAEYRTGAAAWASTCYTVVVLGGALARLWRARRVGALRHFHVLIWTPVVYFTLLHAVYIGSVRYRVPLMSLLAVAAAGAMRPAREQITNPDLDRPHAGF
jgi:hypothetical protein